MWQPVPWFSLLPDWWFGLAVPFSFHEPWGSNPLLLASRVGSVGFAAMRLIGDGAAGALLGSPSSMDMGTREKTALTAGKASSRGILIFGWRDAVWKQLRTISDCRVVSL